MGLAKLMRNRKKKEMESGGGVVSHMSDRRNLKIKQELRNSELWDDMVFEFGIKRSEEILKEFIEERDPGSRPYRVGERKKDVS